MSKQPPLEFLKVPKDKFPCFYLAKQVGSEGESLPTVMNAANEIAVKSFLEKKIKFTDIYKVIFEVLENHEKKKISSIEDVFEIDKISRDNAIMQIKNII